MTNRCLLVLFLLIVINNIYSELPEIYVQLGHNNGVNAIAMSPDGKNAATCDSGGKICIWDLDTGRELRSWIGNEYTLLSLAYSKDGRIIAAGGTDGTISLWEARAGNLIRRIKGHEVHYETIGKTRHQIGKVEAVRITPDSRFVISCSNDKTVKLWDITTGVEVRSFKGHKEGVHALDCSPDGSMVVSAGYKSIIFIHDLNTGKVLKKFNGQHNSVYELRFSPDGKYLLSAGMDKTMRLWDVKSAKCLQTFRGHNDAVTVIDLSSDGKIALSAGINKEIKLWDMETGQLIRTLNVSKEKIFAACFTLDGSHIVAASSSEGNLFDFNPCLLDVSSGKIIKEFERFGSKLFTADVSPDQRLIAYAGDRGKIAVWDLTKARQIALLGKKDRPILKVRFSHNSRYLLSGGSDTDCTLWDMTTMQYVRSFSGHSKQVNAIAFTPDDKKVVSGSMDGTIKIWELSSGRCLKTLKASEGIVCSVAISPDGRLIASGDTDNAIRLWNLASGDEIKDRTWDSTHTNSVMSLDFSPDGQYLASGSDDHDVRIWQVATGNCLKTLEERRWVDSVCFSADGQQILSGSWDNSLRIWNWQDGEVLKTLTGHLDAAYDVSFFNHSELAVSASFDGTARIWDTDSGAEICQFVSLESDEWICLTPGGYYNASANGGQGINVRDGDAVYGIDDFFETYYRPDIVQAILAGNDTGSLERTSLLQGIKTPPAISLAVMTDSGDWQSFEQAGDSARITDGSLRIRITATDTGGGIKELRLLVNRKLIEYEQRGLSLVEGSVLTREYSVALATGVNRITALGFSFDMIQSHPVSGIYTYYPPQMAKPELHVLAIGIDKYKNGRYNLNYCRSDCSSFVESLQPKAGKLFSKVNITQLNDGDASKTRIIAMLDKLAAIMNPEDVFILGSSSIMVGRKNLRGTRHVFLMTLLITTKGVSHASSSRRTNIRSAVKTARIFC